SVPMPSALRVADSGLGIGDSGFGIRDSGFGIRDSGIGIRESKECASPALGAEDRLGLEA
ncbi:hypothetical protein, partial [Xanthomonas campestris]|uniref:hypothetical protein n=1 Tax=Xanthomonas campestris TaxID=339 RepID=UPI0039C03C0C